MMNLPDKSRFPRLLTNRWTLVGIVALGVPLFSLLVRIEEIMSVAAWIWSYVQPLVEWEYTLHLMIVAAVLMFAKGSHDVIVADRENAASIKRHRESEVERRISDVRSERREHAEALKAMAGDLPPGSSLAVM